MNQRNPLLSPSSWLAAGMGLVLGLVCLLLGAGEGFGAWLTSGYEGSGFPKMELVPPGSPAALVALVIFTFGVVFAMEGTPGTGRRVMLLLSGLVVLAMASPVLALWGVFWNPLVLLLAVFWSGLVAMLHAGNRDKAEALRIADEQNVVRMNPPVSPNQRRKNQNR